MTTQHKIQVLKTMKTWLRDYSVTIGTIFICIFVLLIMGILNKIL